MGILLIWQTYGNTKDKKGRLNMRTNEFGEYIDCFMYIDDPRKGRYCNALSDWYNAPTIVNRCKNCPFYKTEDRMMEERKRCTILNKERLNGKK